LRTGVTVQASFEGFGSSYKLLPGFEFVGVLELRAFSAGIQLERGLIKTLTTSALSFLSSAISSSEPKLHSFESDMAVIMALGWASDANECDGDDVDGG